MTGGRALLFLAFAFLVGSSADAPTSSVATSSSAPSNDDATAAGAAEAFALGVKTKEAGDLDTAATLFWTAILHAYSPMEMAMAHFKDCYARKGVPEEAMLFIAKEYLRRGDGQSALKFLDSALDIKEDCAEAHFYKGVAWSSTGGGGDVGLAIRHFYDAVRHDPTNGEYYYTLGTKLFEVDKNDEALVCFEEAVKHRPDLDLAFASMVYLKSRVCEWDDHGRLMKRLLGKAKKELKRGAGPFFIDSHMTLAYPFPPAVKLAIARRHAAHELTEARATMAATGGALVAAGGSSSSNNNNGGGGGGGKADFKLKATSYLIHEMFRHHDRGRYEVFCFATTPNSDKASRKRYGMDWRRTIRASLEKKHFIDVSGKPLREVVRLVRDVHRIHVLVNMDGYSNKGLRLEGLFPLQPAPVQVSMLVYVGTMGADYIQYVVTDKVASPAALEGIYSEKFIWMPQSFFINCHASIPQLSRPHPTRLRKRLRTWFGSRRRGGGGSREAGAAEEEGEGQEDGSDRAIGGTQLAKSPSSKSGGGGPEFVFCNLNRHLKIRPNIFKIWMKVLKRLPGTRLRMLQFPAESERRLRARAAKHGVADAAERIELIEFIGNPYEHQQRIGRLCDAVLDNDIYNAHTMAVDTLWSGVPLLTWGNGKDMGGRVGVSILTTLGLPELVVNTSKAYEATAVRLATDEEFYGEVYRRLIGGFPPAAAAELHDGTTGSCPGGGGSNNSSSNPFWDTKGYVAHLEDGFAQAWDRFVEGKPPGHISVENRKAVAPECAAGAGEDGEKGEES
eukprot:g4702.t1